MMITRSVEKKNKDNSYHSTLRASNQYLNIMILRNTLASSPYAKIPNPNDYYQGSRLSTVPSNYYKPAKGPDSVSYSRLQDTLNSLQTKIEKAQRILESPYIRPRPSKHNIDLDIEISLSDMDERITKKNEETYKFLAEEKISEINNDCSLTTTYKRPRNTQSNSKAAKQYYIGSLANMNCSGADPRFREHLKLSLDVFKKLRDWQARDHREIASYKVTLPVNKADKKTLLLDIDDTILNCDDTKDPHVTYDFEFPVLDEDGSELVAYIKLRPYALTFLKNVARVYEIVAFTGSIESYAKKVIQEIDPEGEIFTHQLYRSSCFEIYNGIYVKDIRIINRRPQNIVLVDNSPYSYIYQLQNGVPIIPYENGPDSELPKLQKYLLQISKCSDIREYNKQTFQFHRYYECESIAQIASHLYGL